MKVHIGVDAQSGLVHKAGVTTGKVHDARVMANLIREDDTAVYGDKGYASDEKKRAAETAASIGPGRRTPVGLGSQKRQRAHKPAFQNARQGRTLFPSKSQVCYRKVRYRGIAKNGAHVFSLFALANLYLARGRLASA